MSPYCMDQVRQVAAIIFGVGAATGIVVALALLLAWSAWRARA